MNIDRAIGLIAVAVAVPVGIVSVSQFGVGVPQSPGAGFWPLLVAVLMTGLGIKLIISPVPDAEDVSETGDDQDGETGSRWMLLGIAFASLVFFTALLETLGYLLCTVLLLLTQLRLVEHRSWRSSILIAVLAAVISFVVFKFMLKLPLPDGIIHIAF